MAANQEQDQKHTNWFDGMSKSSSQAITRATMFSSNLADSFKKMSAPNIRFVGFAQSLREVTFYPLSGLSLNEILERRGWTDVYKNETEWRNNVSSCCGGQEVMMRTADGRRINGLWCPRAHDAALKERDFQFLASSNFLSAQTPENIGMPPRVELPAESAVILFHANAMTALDMVSYILWYRCRGMHVLAVTLGGYPGSQGEPSEITSYMDAECALRWLLNQCPGLTVKRCVAHGLSIGGALATGLAAAYPQLHLTLDQTFINAKEVAQVVASIAFNGFVPNKVVQSMVGTVFPKGVSSTHVIDTAPDWSIESKTHTERLFSLTTSLASVRPPPALNAIPMKPAKPVLLHTSNIKHNDDEEKDDDKDVSKKIMDEVSNIKYLISNANLSEGQDYKEFVTDSYNSEKKLKQLSKLAAIETEGSRSAVGNLFVFSSHEDLMMPSSFADRLLKARFHYLLHEDEVEENEVDDDDDEYDDEEDGEEPLSSVGHKRHTHFVKHVIENPDVARHHTGAVIRTFKEIQTWNTLKLDHFAQIKGGHGTFFGDQMGPSTDYQRHLEKIGLIANRKTYTLAIQDARKVMTAREYMEVSRYTPST